MMSSARTFFSGATHDLLKNPPEVPLEARFGGAHGFRPLLRQLNTCVESLLQAHYGANKDPIFQNNTHLSFKISYSDPVDL